jgi:hypothetical protein
MFLDQMRITGQIIQVPVRCKKAHLSTRTRDQVRLIYLIPKWKLREDWIWSQLVVWSTPILLLHLWVLPALTEFKLNFKTSDSLKKTRLIPKINLLWNKSKVDVDSRSTLRILSCNLIFLLNISQERSWVWAESNMQICKFWMKKMNTASMNLHLK